MNIGRSIGAVVAGYLIFAIAAVLLFHVIGVDPHDAVSTMFMILSTLYGAFFAGLGGYAAARIAGRQGLLHAAAVMILIDLGAIASLVYMLGRAPIWSPLATLIVMPPAALLGGFIRQRTAA